MKKIFIGCGVIALLVLGFLGVLAYQVVPVIMEAIDHAQLIGGDLLELETEFPFDEADLVQLDTDRFATALDLRVEVATELEVLGLNLTEVSRMLEEKDPSIFGYGTAMKDLLDEVAPAAARAPEMLRQHAMSTTELGWHTQLMWATLRLVDNGDPDEAMEPLRGQFTGFRRAYEDLEKQQGDEFPPLNDVIGEFEPGFLEAAKAVFAQDPQRVLDGMTDPALEIIYLSSLTEAMEGNSGIRVRVNGKDVVGGNSDDSAAPVDG